MQHDFSVDLRILDSNMEMYLETELFELYKQTYPTAEYECIWNAYDAVTELFHVVGKRVADEMGFIYPEQIEEDMLGFIERLREM